MPTSLPPTARFSDRAHAAAEWVLVAGLLATFVGTTLCLGGFLAQTMVVAGTAVLGLGALGALLWMTGRAGESRAVNRAVFVPLPFLLYALASTLWWAPAGWLAWREWLLWFQMWIVFALTLHFGRGRAHTRLIVGAFAVLAVTGIGMAIYQRFSAPDWIMLGRKQAPQFHGRSSAMFGIPNSFAALLELVIPVCLALLFSRAVKPGVKIIGGWLAGLGLVGLALTGSRGGWLGLTLALLAWPLLATRHWRKKLAGAAVVAGLISAGLWALYHASDYARGRMEPFLDGRLELSRPKVWAGAVGMWRAHPWFGTGAGSFGLMFDRFRPAGYPDDPVWAHNDYLNTLSDYGLAGFVLWAGAGAGLAWLGWLGIRRAQRAGTPAANLFGLAKWKLGLLLGLLAFAFHLVVDFHTKIPALAYAVAIVAALLLRDEGALLQRVPRACAWAGGGLLAVIAAGLAIRTGLPLYRAEALRFEARRTVDRYAVRPEGRWDEILTTARLNLSRATRIDPSNGQAWADLAYITELGTDGKQGDRVGRGHFAELAANRALELCPGKAEFWVRKGVALDLQLGRPEAEACYRRAVELAPNSAIWWYHYAHHLQGFPERKQDARAAIDTCLALDPYYRGADILRQQLTATR